MHKARNNAAGLVPLMREAYGRYINKRDFSNLRVFFIGAILAASGRLLSGELRSRNPLRAGIIPRHIYAVLNTDGQLPVSWVSVPGRLVCPDVVSLVSGDCMDWYLLCFLIWTRFC